MYVTVSFYYFYEEMCIRDSRMDEIKTITDRVTVMRDGGYVGTLITADSTKEDIINMMVGRVIYEDQMCIRDRYNRYQ